MSVRWQFGLLGVVAAFGLAACGGDDGSGDDGEPLGGSLTITGDVVDFQTRMPVTTGASLSAVGLMPPPQVQVQGSSFTLLNVPENSTFQVLANAPPGNRATYSQITVTDSDVDRDAPRSYRLDRTRHAG